MKNNRNLKVFRQSPLVLVKECEDGSIELLQITTRLMFRIDGMASRVFQAFDGVESIDRIRKSFEMKKDEPLILLKNIDASTKLLKKLKLIEEVDPKQLDRRF